MKASLRIDTGAITQATGTLTVYEPGPRTAKAIGLALGGFIAAGICLFVPLLHLITTWLLPILGLWAAWNGWRTQESYTSVEGACPACAAAISLDGGRVADPMWDQCPACKRPVQIIIDRE